MDFRDPNALPAEVLLNIISCLPAEQAFLSRQLSTYYNEFLNDQTINIRLRQEDTHHPSDSNADALRDRSIPETFDQEFTRRKDLFRAHQTVPDILYAHVETETGSDPMGFVPQLKGKYLAWTEDENMFVLDLSNNTLQTADIDFELEGFCLTSKLLVTLSNGWVSWRSITAAQHEIAEIELPNYTAAVAGEGDQLAVLVEYEQHLRLFFIDTTRALITRTETLLATDWPGTHALHVADVTTVLSAAVFTLKSRTGELTRTCTLYLTTVGSSKTRTLIGEFLVKHAIEKARLDATGDGKWHIYVNRDRGCCPLNLRQEADGSWSNIPVNFAATWKGKTYLKTEGGIRVGRYEILRNPSLAKTYSSALLVNDSFLVDWTGGDNTVHDVYCFDKTATTVNSVPLEMMDRVAFAQSGEDVAYTQDSGL